MWTFALLRDSSDLHIYKDAMGKEVNPKKNEKLPLNYNKNRLPEFQLQLKNHTAHKESGAGIQVSGFYCNSTVIFRFFSGLLFSPYKSL